MALTNLDLTLPSLGSSPGELVAENKYVYPSFEIPSGTVTVRTNLYSYANAEDGTTTGWTPFGSSFLQNLTTNPHSGTRSYSATVTGAAVNEGMRILPANGAQSGTTGTETHSAWVYAPLGATMQMQLRESTIGGAGQVIRATTLFVGTGAWQRISVSGSKATAANVMTLVIATQGTVQAIQFYVDDVLAEVGPTLNDYFDGNTPDAGDFEYVWSGTANASVSYMLANGILGVSDDGVYQSQEWAAEGTHSAFVPTGKTLTVALADPSTVKVIARSVGQTMTVGGNAVMSVGSDETLTAFGDTSVVLGPGHWDLLTIVEGVYNGPPFTGSSDYTGYSAAWTGTPDESTSTLTLAPLASPLGDIVSWSITEPTTPHNIHRRNGSTGAASVTAKAREDTYWTISEDANITVDGLQGTFVGTINQSQISPFQEHGEPSGGVTFSIESVLNQLNAERTLAPVVNEPLSDVVATYVAAVAPTLTVTWLASTNPTKTYSAWSGNVWDILKTLCAANNIEMALNGSTLLIRDLGTNIVRFDSRENQGFDVENVSLSITPGSGQFVEITYRDSVAIDNQASYNYVDNPSVEINATGYGVRTTAFGAISGSRVTN